MCKCYINNAGELVVCDLCASQQIEALNIPAPGQVELTPGTLSTQECNGLTLAVTSFFVQLQSSVQVGGHS